MTNQHHIENGAAVPPPLLGSLGSGVTAALEGRRVRGEDVTHLGRRGTPDADRVDSTLALTDGVRAQSEQDGIVVTHERVSLPSLAGCARKTGGALGAAERCLLAVHAPTSNHQR